MNNNRPADFPTDAELAAMQPVTTLAELIDAFVGSPEWDEHDVREQCEAAAWGAKWGREDAETGYAFVPEQFFVPGTVQYAAYCAAYQAVTA